MWENSLYNSTHKNSESKQGMDKTLIDIDNKRRSFFKKHSKHILTTQWE